MKKFRAIIRIIFSPQGLLSILLIFGHYQLETSEILEKKYPWMAETYINPFWDDDYVFPVIEGQPAGIRLTWWIKTVTDDVLWIIAFFIMCAVTRHYSFRLFRVCALWLLFHFVDAIMLWWNYRSEHWCYYLMDVTIFLCILSMFLPERERAVVKNLK